MDVRLMIRQLEIAQLGISTALTAFREIEKQMAPPPEPKLKDEPRLPVDQYENLAKKNGRPTPASRRQLGERIRAAEPATA